MLTDRQNNFFLSLKNLITNVIPFSYGQEKINVDILVQLSGLQMGPDLETTRSGPGRLS